MIYTPTDDEAACAWAVAKRRNSLNGGGSNLSTEETSTQQHLEVHYQAALAEIAVSRILNLCWSGCGKGVEHRDVGGFLEVRSINDMSRGLLARDKDDDDSPCVLVMVTKTRTCEVLGWNYFWYVKAEGALRDKNGKRYWVLRQDQLWPLDTLRDVYQLREVKVAI